MNETESRQATLVGYDSIRKRLRRIPVHPRFRAVYLSGEGVLKNVLIGNGTLIVDGIGRHVGVITASHLFPAGQQKDYVSYRILQPQSPLKYPIRGIYQVTKEDVAFCRPGKPEKVGDVSQHKGNYWENLGTPKVVKRYFPNCTHIVTGEIVPVVGYVDIADERYYVLQCTSYPGESGTGLLKSDNELYVMVASIALSTPISFSPDSPADTTQITLAALVHIGKGK